MLFFLLYSPGTLYISKVVFVFGGSQNDVSRKAREMVILQHTFTHIVAVDHDATIIECFRRERPWGLATSIDLHGCNPDLIGSAANIRAFVSALCKLIDTRQVGPTIIVDFDEDKPVSGHSMTQLIETSLISGHFVNEHHAAYIDICSCKAYPPYMAAAFAKEFFEAEQVKVSINFRF